MMKKQSGLIKNKMKSTFAKNDNDNLFSEEEKQSGSLSLSS